jgi:hypothetical protein
MYKTPTKECKFCFGSAVNAPLQELAYYGIDIYFCHDCKAEYLFYQSGNTASVSLYTEINGKTYRWSATPPIYRIWLIRVPGIPGQKRNEGTVVVKSFKDDTGELSKVNPSNVNEKLKTWLVFI